MGGDDDPTGQIIVSTLYGDELIIPLVLEAEAPDVRETWRELRNRLAHGHRLDPDDVVLALFTAAQKRAEGKETA